MTLAKVEDPQQPAGDPAPLCAMPALTPLQQEDVEDRRFRRWIIKTCIYAALFCVVVLVTATAIVGVKNGQLPNNELVSKLIDFAQELVPVVNLIVGNGQ